MNERIDMGPLDRLTVGTVGPPGQRVFLLQATNEVETVTVKMEKGQVAALAQYLAAVIAKAGHPGEPPTDLDLELPAEPRWAVGSMSVSYDEEEQFVRITAEESEDEGPEGGKLHFLISLEQAAAVAIHGTRLVESGRPPCPLCGYPLSPEGHDCPRTNGHRPPSL